MTEQQQQSNMESRPLQTKWTFWFDVKGFVNPQDAQPVQANSYRDHLKKLATFDTIEQFVRYYAFLERPSQLPKNSNYHLFRHEIVPMWESYPQGGCWMVKIKKNPALLDRLWEQLVLAAICELFEEPNVVGVVLSIRSKEDVLSVWNRDSSNQRAKLAIGEKMKQILHLGPRSIIQYKHNKLSIKDGSTFRNTRLFIIEDEQKIRNAKESSENSQ
jgi:translation initiation factor 4E